MPLIWPCDNSFGKVKDYFDDQKSADASGTAYMRLLQKFLAWRDENSTLENPCLKRVNILSYSMGNRVLRSALNLSVKYYPQNSVALLFRNVFMAAADVVNESLEPGNEGDMIPPMSRNVVVYYAADDLALRASKVANVNVSSAAGSRRLGHTGPEKMDKVPRNVYAIDCDDFNNQYDSPWAILTFSKTRRRVMRVYCFAMPGPVCARAASPLPRAPFLPAASKF